MVEVKPTLLPVVRWAQKRRTLSLKVELQECQHPNILLSQNSINFSALAVGAKGENQYAFTLDFFKNIDVESVIHTVTGSSIGILLTKEGVGEWWPRLTKQTKSPHFLKLDFDKWKSESDEEENLDKSWGDFKADDQARGKRNREAVQMLKGYLIIYNMIQFLGYLYIFLFCTINLYRGGRKVFPHTYERVGNAVHLAVTLSFMEVIHPLTGMTKGSWRTPLLQSGGRNFASFCLWLASDYIKSEWYVTALFVVWSSIELVRYPFYICQIGNITSKALTWMRYTIWIPLYPSGVLLEAVLFIRASQTFTEQGLYELQLPNSLNATLRFTWLIKLYVALLFYCFATIMVPHMWKMRKNKLGGRKKYKQP